MNTTTNSPTPRRTVQMIYLGARNSVRNQKDIYHLYAKVTDEQIDSATFPNENTFEHYSKELGDGGTPGHIFTIDETLDGKSVFQKSFKYMGLWPDGAKRAELTTLHRAAIANQRAAKLVAAALKSDAALERLEPFRKAYSEAVGKNRAQILANIVAYIAS